MIAESTLRELGATHRTFKTVKGAMLFYRDELSRRLSVSRGFEVGLAPRSREERNADQAACAAISRCIVANHWSDESIDSARMMEELPLEQGSILFLVAHYENTESNGQELAQQWALDKPRPKDSGENPTWRFIRWCRIVERVLRHRMVAARVIRVIAT